MGIKKMGVWVLVVTLFIFMSILNYYNTGTPGGADSYMHHLFGKWAFVHPHLFFDHWGKPMFTIFSAPFAQFGFKGSVTFNILIAIFSGVLVYKSALKLEVSNAWVGILFTVFTPIFFLVSFSSLTEIVFAFLVTLSLYFFINKQFSWSVIVMGFVPFARSEGVIFFPLLIIALLALKKYKQIPLLAVGFMVMAVAGYPIYGDILWPITKNPYHDASALYGSGKLLHFVNFSPKLFGWPLISMFGIGVGLGLVRFWKNKVSHISVVWFLLLSVSIGYFAAHSVVWAYGMGGSAGLIRVMAGVAPVMALVALLGFDGLVKLLPNIKGLRLVLVLIMGVVMGVEGTTKPNLPLKQGQEEVVLEKVAAYIKQKNLTNNYMVYFNPVVAYLLELDHFTKVDSRERVADNAKPANGLPQGTVFIWDAHFGPNEGGLAKSVLDESPFFEKVKTFTPEHAFTTFAGQDYEVIIYQINQD